MRFLKRLWRWVKRESGLFWLVNKPRDVVFKKVTIGCLVLIVVYIVARLLFRTEYLMIHNAFLGAVVNSLGNIWLAVITSVIAAGGVEILARRREEKAKNDRKDFSYMFPLGAGRTKVAIIMPKYPISPGPGQGKHKYKKAGHGEGSVNLNQVLKNPDEGRDFYAYADVKATNYIISLFQQLELPLPGVTSDLNFVEFLNWKKNKSDLNVNNYVDGIDELKSFGYRKEDLKISLMRFEEVRTIFCVGLFSNIFLTDVIGSFSEYTQSGQDNWMECPDWNHFFCTSVVVSPEKQIKKIMLSADISDQVNFKRVPKVSASENIYDDSEGREYALLAKMKIAFPSGEKTIIVCGGISEKTTRLIGAYVSENWRKIRYWEDNKVPVGTKSFAMLLEYINVQNPSEIQIREVLRVFAEDKIIPIEKLPLDDAKMKEMRAVFRR